MTKVKYPYRVKYNGVYYPPDTEIDIGITDKNDNGAEEAAEAAPHAPVKAARKKTAKSSAAK